MQISRNMPAILLHFLSKFTLQTSNTFLLQLTFLSSILQWNNTTLAVCMSVPTSPQFTENSERCHFSSMESTSPHLYYRPGISSHILEDFTIPWMPLFSRSPKTSLIPTSNSQLPMFTFLPAALIPLITPSF